MLDENLFFFGLFGSFLNTANLDQQFWVCVEFFIRCPFLALAPDHVWSLVDLWLDVDVSVACFCNGSGAPLHVLSVELELEVYPRAYRNKNTFKYVNVDIQPYLNTRLHE